MLGKPLPDLQLIIVHPRLSSVIYKRKNDNQCGSIFTSSKQKHQQ